jgi:hypothetical protein
MSQTPGPWNIGADSIFRVDSHPDDEDILCIFYDDGVPSIWVPNPDDRTLIEAATDLLEACKDTDEELAKLQLEVDHVACLLNAAYTRVLEDWLSRMSRLQKKAKAAIAKAEGKT